jgi:hypothetical protein
MEEKMIAIALTSMVSISSASAQWSDSRMSGTAGRCPDGQYAKGGGIYANDVKNCSSKNLPYAARFGTQPQKKK